MHRVLDQPAQLQPVCFKTDQIKVQVERFKVLRRYMEILSGYDASFSIEEDEFGGDVARRNCKARDADGLASREAY
jgi:hypothetical protein